MTTATTAVPVSHRGSLDTVQSARRGLARVPMSVIELAMRVGVGMVFWKSSMLKLDDWDSTVALFANEYRLPVLPPQTAAVMGTAVELTGAILLLVGLGARFGAAALLGLTLTIQLLVYPENWPDHLLWGSILAYVLTRGAGRLSVDHLIARRLGLG